MAQFCRKSGPFVDAIRLEGDTRVPLLGEPNGWIEARKGDWLVTDGDGEQRVLTNGSFRELYEPATDEARRLLVEPEGV